MWVRCRNALSGHEASIPVGLLDPEAEEPLTDWVPLGGPSDVFEEPAYGLHPVGEPTTEPEPGDPAEPITEAPRRGRRTPKE